jgi:nitronate monooxygenase
MRAAVVMSTPFTRLFSLPYPIALAPMGGSAGGALAAALSNGGGLGLIGSGDGDPDWLEREVSIVVDRTLAAQAEDALARATGR